jgi:hypothetical protein
MKPTYEVTTGEFGATIIFASYEDGRLLSFTDDPANSDYQAYLKSLEENN